MKSRRNFLKQSVLGVGAMGFVPGLFANAAQGQAPKRFIFIHKGNGLFPKVMVPPTLGEADAAKEKGKEAFEVSLAEHELPGWMGALNEHKEDMTILQGLSGKMCTTGHHTWQSSLGVFKANERLSSIKWATVDFELAKLFPSPLEHIELACFPNGGGNARGNIEGIEKGFSARGPQQPNYAFGSPKVAMQELFKSVAGDRDGQVQYELERKVLEFAARNQSSLGEPLSGIERSKVLNYAESIEAIRERNYKVEAMGDVIRQHLPQLDDKYFVDDLNTIDRQKGFAEILLSTLTSGMTNVVAFTADELGTRYTGIADIENENVNLHDVGHNKSVGRFGAEEVREKVRRHHMDAVNTIVSRLKSVPEDGGTMFDNTMVFYFPDNGETHHSHGTEWPFIVMAGSNCRLDIGGKYIRLPGYGKEGHKTLGNFYTTILNAYGNPIEHYGALDTGLGKFGIDQTGPIKHFLGPTTLPIHPMNARRNFLKASGATLALPWLESIGGFAHAAGFGDSSPQRLLMICLPLGIYPDGLRPVGEGPDYEASEYLSAIEEFRDQTTVFSGLDHPGVNGGHSAEPRIFTGIPSNKKNARSLDQYIAGKIGQQTRYDSLALSAGRNQFSWTDSGTVVPAETKMAKIYAKLFVNEGADSADKVLREIGHGKSIMDLVNRQAKSLQPKLSRADQEKLQEYFESVRETERRLTKSEGWVHTPKPSVEAPMPEDPADRSEIIPQLQNVCDMTHLAFKTDSTRVITFGYFEQNQVKVPGVNNAYHGLSHHGKDPNNINQLKLIETEFFKGLAGLLTKLRDTREGDATLLDRTTVVVTSNLGNGSNHSNKDLPVLLFGGNYHHGQHLVFEPSTVPLSNLYVSVLNQFGLDDASFGASTGPLEGLEVG